jgi:outer membrane protein assembly factor BamA
LRWHSAVRFFGFIVLSLALVSPAFANGSSIVVKAASGASIEIQARSGGIAIPLPQGLDRELAGLSESIMSQKLIRELVRAGKFRDVTITKESAAGSSGMGANSLVLWRVSMKPQRMIHSVSISGLGLLDEGQYRKRLRSRDGSIFLEDAIDEDVITLTDALQQRGYPFAKVASVQIRGVPSGAVTVDFSVNKGRVCRLSEVRTEGAESFIERVALPIEPGAVCNVQQIRKSLAGEQERLRGLGYLTAKLDLEQVMYSADRSSASLTVRVDRGPLTRIEAVDLATGAIKDDFIKDDKGLSSFDLSNLTDEDLKREVQSFYLSDGYAQVKVTGPTQVELKSGDRVLRFFVQKGQRISIGLVEFTGDSLPVPRADALGAMNLNPGILSPSLAFDERRLAEYRDSLQALLLGSGYGDAQVDLPRTTISRSGGTARLDFNLRLGKLFTLAELSILGLPDGFEVNQSDLNDIAELGEPLSLESIRNLREDLRKQLIETGHYYAQVNEKPVLQVEDDGTKQILLVLEVAAGPIVRIRNVYLEGETYGKSERIKLVSLLERGAVFAPAELEKARRRIMRYELFSSVAVEAFDLAAIERKEPDLDVVIRTIGRGGYTLALSPGYGSRNGYRFGVEFVRNELNESGLRFNSNSSVSQDKEQLPIGDAPQQIGRKISAGLTEPLFRVGQWVSPFDARILAGTEVSNVSFETRVFETIDFSFRWRPVFFDLDFDFEWGVAREWSQTLSQRIEPLEVINNPSVQIHELVLKAAFDTRDSIEWARKGMYHEILSQHARFGLDSDVSYDRYTLSTNFFVPFLSRWSHAFSFGLVSISDVLNKNQNTVTAPSSRRAALTGRAAVRGFPESGRSLGPLIWLDFNSGDGSVASGCSNAVRSIGATNVVYAKYELRYRTAYLNNMLGLAWFVDSGAAFFSDGELSNIQRKIEEEIALTGRSSGECSLDQARIFQPPGVGARGSRTPLSYLEASYISSGVGLRFIIPNFAAISFDWGLPIQDPAILQQSGCSTISEAETAETSPACIKRDRQDRLFGVIPFPGAFNVGIGATL